MRNLLKLRAPAITINILILASLICSGCTQVQTNTNTTQKDQRLIPFWKSSVMYGESVLFIQQNEDELPSARLLFNPKKIIAFRNASATVEYKQGKDYLLDKNTGTLSLPAGSPVIFKKKSEILPAKMFFSEGHFFHDRQIEITYTHKDTWKGFTPKFAGNKLPKTMAKLKKNMPLKVHMSGDSISAGWNASGKTGAPPYQPDYGTLVVGRLAELYNANVTFENFSVGGWTAANGVADAQRMAAAGPDLVIIAYGMNDIVDRNPKTYKANILTIIETVRKINPDTEFILVASMIGNLDWDVMPPAEEFFKYRDALSTLTETGIVLADMTTFWNDLLKRKTFIDITGNGVNHPNDFGHRIYAQTILEMLTTNSQN